MTLKDLKPNEYGIVLNVASGGTLRKRIIDMGITCGVTVFVRKVAPLGDPIEIKIRGYELSLRKTEAESITVEKFNPTGCTGKGCGGCGA